MREGYDNNEHSQTGDYKFSWGKLVSFSDFATCSTKLVQNLYCKRGMVLRPGTSLAKAALQAWVHHLKYNLAMMGTINVNLTPYRIFKGQEWWGDREESGGGRENHKSRFVLLLPIWSTQGYIEQRSSYFRPSLFLCLLPSFSVV